jgi:fucose 4-O-acetylase-like acetyltransferase
MTGAGTPTRLDDLDRMKGMVILLVALGHVVAREPPAGHAWWDTLRAAIYAFHMPAFLYLGGLVMAHTGGLQVGPGAAYRVYLRRRTVRLLVPFFGLGLLVVAGKLALAPFLHVDNAPEDAGAAMLGLFWDTSRSPSLTVWYVFVAFVYAAALPLLVRLSDGSIAPAVGLAVLLFALPVPPVAYLDRVAGYAVFFAAGLLAGRLLPTWLDLVDRHRAAAWMLFGASLGLVFLPVPTDLRLLVVGLLSMPALHALARRPAVARQRLWAWLGRYAFIIYLLNTVAIGFAKALLLEAFGTWDGANFLVFAPTLFAAGLLGPIAVKVLVLHRNILLDRLTN